MKLNIKLTALAAGLALASSIAQADKPNDTPYEIWAADQSNSTAVVGGGRGTDGSYLWIWQSEDMKAQVKGKGDAVPEKLDMHDVFPGSLVETDNAGPTGDTLGDLPNFGRLHGMLPDPQQKYMNINSFTPGGGFVGIIDGVTKEAVALFRVTQTNGGLSGSGRSLHMSFWNADGSALLLANLHGRILERIDIDRDADGNITGANYNIGASLNVGAALSSIDDSASAFNGNGMVPSGVTGSYDAVAALGGSTPTGAARQGSAEGRPVNVIVCPIVSNSGKVYVTFGGGGLLIADGASTPMNIIAEYDRTTVNGAGCGGVQDRQGMVWLNAGASAAGSGATQSTFTMYGFDDAAPMDGTQGVNMPAPTVIFKDANNTATIGNTTGEASIDDGQLPGVTTRRDAHGMSITIDGAYIHQSDRLQNNVEVFKTASMEHIGTYDLTSANGQGKGTGPCEAYSVSDDTGLPTNDVTPDLMGTTPDGEYMVVATRGPSPVSVGHNAQGSCPGVGIIKMENGGKSGKLVTVLRTTNTVDLTDVNAKGGHAYTGTERSDPHGASIRVRVEDMK